MIAFSYDKQLPIASIAVPVQEVGLRESYFHGLCSSDTLLYSIDPTIPGVQGGRY